MEKKKIVITGGHLTPALAVIDELQKRKEWEILFFGRKQAAEGDKTPSVEFQIIPKRGVLFVPINAGRIQRHFTRYTIPAFLRIPLGFFQAFYFLLRFKPDIVLSFGGYVSVPVVLAAWFLRIPTVTHEQTTIRSLATKINAFFAQKIAVSWPQIVKKFPSRKVVLTGNPIRKEILQPIKKTLDFDKDLPLIFITGGNQGSHVINQAVEKALPKLLELTNIFHQCGHLQTLGDFERLVEKKENLPMKLKKRYQVKRYLDSQEMAAIFNQADLVVSRAGANTITELAALGKPALLIPFPWLYANEQKKNAMVLVKAGIAEILPQNEVSEETLLEASRKMLKNLFQYQKNAWKAKKLVQLNAAQKIIELVAETAR